MLPDELWYQVFTTLDWRSVIQCEKVCRKWKQIANDEYLWRKLLLENFLDATTSTDDIEQIQSYKHLFFKHFCLQKNWDEGIFQEFCFVAPAAILQARLNGNLLFTGALNTKIYIFNLSEAVYDKFAIKTSKFHHQQLSQLQAKAKKKVVSKYVPPHLRGNDYELPNLHSEKIYIAPLPEPVEVSGHTDSVISLEIFDKRKLFMSCSNDSYLKLWDYSHFNAKPELVHTFVGHQRSVRALQFYEGDNGLYCISSSKDRSVKVWDIDNKTLLHSFDMSGPVHAFQASAGTIVSSDSAGAVSIRDFSTMDPIANFQASSSWITTLFFDHASKLLFTGCYSGKTKVFDIRDGSFIASFHQNTQPVNCMHVDMTSNLLYTGGDSVCIYDFRMIDNHQPLYEYSDHELHINAIKVVKNTFVTGSADGTVGVFDTHKGLKYKLLANDTMRQKAVLTVHADEKKIISGNWQGACHLWNFDHTFTFETI